MKGIVLVLVVAVLVEAFVEYGKSIGKMFTEGEVKTAVTQLCAIVVSVVLCLLAGADLFAAVEIAFEWPWVGVMLTGVLASRGANYVSDFVKKLHTTKGGV